MQEISFKFAGVITEEVRKSLRELRFERGMSIHSLAKEMDISWLTLRNWENGVTTKCHPGTYRKLCAYLERDAQRHGSPGRTGQLRGLLTRFAQVVELCSARSEVREELSNVLAKMIEESSRPSGGK